MALRASGSDRLGACPTSGTSTRRTLLDTAAMRWASPAARMSEVAPRTSSKRRALASLRYACQINGRSSYNFHGLTVRTMAGS